MWKLKYSSTILDLGTRWRWVISFTPLPLYPWGKKLPEAIRQEAGLAPHGRYGEEKNLVPAGNWTPVRRYTDWAIPALVTIAMPVENSAESLLLCCLKNRLYCLHVEYALIITQSFKRQYKGMQIQSGRTYFELAEADFLQHMWLGLAFSEGPNRVGVCHPPHLRTETDPVSETSCSLEYRTMDKVQNPGNPKCYTPSSGPFRIYLIIMLQTIWVEFQNKRLIP
jgi:hypothetical protein